MTRTSREGGHQDPHAEADPVLTQPRIMRLRDTAGQAQRPGCFELTGPFARWENRLVSRKRGLFEDEVGLACCL